MMILKRDNVERIVKDENAARSLLADGWKEVGLSTETVPEPVLGEKPAKRTAKKKTEGAN